MALLCDVVDKEDMEPILIQFMPGVFEHFESTMFAIKTVETFNFEQNNYIISVVEIISAAAKCTPQLFQEYIHPIMENFVIIVNRSSETDESQLF